MLSSAISASVNAYRFGLLKIRSKTNRGVPKLFSSVIVSPIVLWTDIQATSLAIFSLPCSAGGRYWCTIKFPSLNLCVPAKNTKAHADAQVCLWAIHVFIWFLRTYRAKRKAPNTLPPIEFSEPLWRCSLWQCYVFYIEQMRTTKVLFGDLN